jgi:hypothetical protein
VKVAPESAIKEYGVLRSVHFFSVAIDEALIVSQNVDTFCDQNTGNLKI